MEKILSLLLLCPTFVFADNIEVAFSPDQGTEQLVVKVINSAKKTVHVAAYSFTSKPISEALYTAYRRGIDVKIIADKEANTRGYTATTYLANHNVPVRLDGNYKIFHNKFIIVDGQTVETGSFNYSAAAQYKNAENVLVIWNDPQVATIYDKKWSSYWNEAAPLKANY